MGESKFHFDSNKIYTHAKLKKTMHCPKCLNKITYEKFVMLPTYITLSTTSSVAGVIDSVSNRKYKKLVTTSRTIYKEEIRQTKRSFYQNAIST